MNIGKAMRVSSSGMTAERFRMDVISGNIANANTVNKPGQPEIRRQNVVFRQSGNGVEIAEVRPDQSPLRREYDPSHPNAINGWVTYSNINPVYEMVDMIGASRSYEANLSAFNTAKQMMNAALNIGKTG